MVSLEPCLMCLTRLLLAGIGEIVYLANDYAGGMAKRLAGCHLGELRSRLLANIR
jgi:tRNA(adenine34) deaminase